jgi:drug/metabolite transporter (DMT)-like permease
LNGPSKISLQGAGTAPRLGIGLLLAATGAVAFSGKAIIVKLSYRYGVDAVAVIMLRMVFALPLFLVLAWWAGRGKPALATRDRWAIVGLGFCGYYLSSFLDFLGLQYISASLERLILYLNPTIVLLLGLVVFGRKVGARQLAAMGVSYAGIALVFGHELSLAGSNVVLGAALIFACAITYAIYLVYSGEIVHRIGALRLTGLSMTVACLFSITQYFILRPAAQVLEFPAPLLWLAVLNAVVCTLAPVVMVMMAIERVGATLTAQAGMIGPMSTVAMGVLLLGEPFTAWVVAGTVLVIAGVWLLARAR